MNVPAFHFSKVAYNGQGLPKYGNLYSVSPEPMMIEKLKMKITTKS
jgi:hypothetical protein